MIITGGLFMSYLYLAVKYLIHDKKRTIQTILGVTLVAVFLYSGLWVFLSVNDYISPEFHVAIRSTDPDLVRDLIRDRSVHTVEVGKAEGIAQAARLSGSSEELKPWSEEAVILVRLHRLPKHPRSISPRRRRLQRRYQPRKS
jgi:hypothetical protein